MEEIDPTGADVLKGHKYELGDIDVKQDYEQAAKYFAKAASQGNAEGMYNLARLTDRGLGVKKDHNLAFKLLEQAAAQSPEHPIFKCYRNVGVAEAEHAIGVRYFEGITVRKDLGVAIYWYQRATDHGSALAANNLGSMYLDALVVDKDLDKAEQLLELAARRGDPLAMLTLAELLLYKNNIQMAKIWYDRACEGGNVVAQNNRDQFAKKLEKSQQYSSNELAIVNPIKNLISLLPTENTASVLSDHSYVKDYNMLSEHANLGSITAKQLCTALDHFAQALNILLLFEILTEEQEDMFVHELSQCYRIEPIVAQIPCGMHKRVSDVIDGVLCRCTKESNSVASQLDEDVRLCYVTLHINSYELVNQFLGPCKQKYPKSIYFFLMSGSVNGFLCQPQDALYNINNGLQIEPENCELLYHKAVLLRHLGIDIDEAIKAYQTFLRVAPKDHRKVPEAYYEMAICYPQPDTFDVAMDSVKKLYEEGKQAEKLQLPCFLPYKSLNIAYIKPIIDIIESEQNIKPVSVNNRQQRLTDPHRVDVIKKHREWEGQGLKEKPNPAYTVISITHKPRLKQQTPKSLIGLKPLTLKMHITNPYLRIGVNDKKPSVRVDDLSSIVMQNKSERILNMCRYCCEANASKVCSRCQQAHYCSKECQIKDWQLYKHKLICKNK